MPQIDETSLSGLLSKGVSLRSVEPHIYSVLPNIEVDSSYDKKFGDIYDWVACNPIASEIKDMNYPGSFLRQLSGDKKG